MRTFGWILCVCCVGYMAPAAAQTTAVGFIVGDPTGLSLKSWRSRAVAWDLGLGWSLGKRTAFDIKLDATRHNYKLLKTKQGKAPVYLGIGMALHTGASTTVALRLPIGVNYIFRRDPAELFMEIVPVLGLVPSSDFTLATGFGARFRF